MFQAISIIAALMLAQAGDASAGSEAVQAPIEGAQPLNDGTWFLQGDYPVEALRAGAEGTVSFQVAVDISGRVTSCQILSSSNSIALDRATCNLVTSRGKFMPGRDTTGKAVASHYRGVMHWRMN